MEYKTFTEDETDYNGSHTLDTSTRNTEWDYIKDITDVEETHNILEHIQRFKQDGRAITHNINILLETTNKLKLVGSHFYKEVCIYGHLITIYKQLGTPRKLKDCYVTFNGKYAIQDKEFYKLKIADGTLLEKLLENHNIKCFI